MSPLLKPGPLRHTSPVNAVRDEMYARFWGVRGSIPVSDPRCARYGGNTSCVEVRCGGSVLVFDAGTGLRPLGAALVREGREDLDLFLSHGHIDHVVGLPFFAFAYQSGNSLRVWSGHQAPGSGTTESTVRSLMSSPLLPITPDIFSAEVSFRDFSAGDDIAPPCGVSIRTARLRHPGGATGYRVEHGGRSICYVTDTEHDPEAPDENILALAEGADVLIYDAMFTDEELPRHRGWGHSTWEEGARLCRAAGVGTYAIFHHAPERDDGALDRIGDAAVRVFPGSLVAREGMVLTP